MKVLHIISVLASGGAEVYVRDLVRQMVLERNEVCIAYISSAKALGRSVEFEADYKAQLSDAGVLFTELGHACRRNPLLGGLRLRALIKKCEPDVIHAHLYYGVVFKALANVSMPLVYTHHSHRLGKGRYLYPLFNHVVNQFIGISRDCSVVLSEIGAKPVSTVYNGVDSARLKTKSNHNENLQQLRAISVGGLFPPKNYPLLIRSLKDLFARRPEFRNFLSLQIVEATQP